MSTAGQAGRTWLLILLFPYTSYKPLAKLTIYYCLIIFENKLVSNLL